MLFEFGHGVDDPVLAIPSEVIADNRNTLQDLNKLVVSRCLDETNFGTS